MNVERARHLMAEAGLDLLLANSIFNVAYLSGFIQHHWVWDGIQHFMERNIWRDEARPLAGFCLDPSKTSFLAVHPWVIRHNHVYPGVDVSAASANKSPLRENQFRFPPLESIVLSIRVRGLESARIGYEETRLPVHSLRLL